MASAAHSVAAGALAIGLAHGLKLIRPVAKDPVVTRADVEGLPDTEVVRMRAEAEAMVQ